MWNDCGGLWHWLASRINQTCGVRRDAWIKSVAAWFCFRNSFWFFHYVQLSNQNYIFGMLTSVLTTKKRVLPPFFREEKKNILPTKESGKLQAIEMPRMFATWSVARGRRQLGWGFETEFSCQFMLICIYFALCLVKRMGKGFEQR